MLAPAKIEDTECILIEFPTNKLIKYLENYDITKQNFNYNITNSNELEILRKYHDDQYEHAAILTADDEYVGYTFDHLEEISKILNRKK